MNAGEGVDYLLDAETGLEFCTSAEFGHRSQNGAELPVSRSTNPWSSRAEPRCRLLLTSMDVIHAWWVPDFRRQAFRDTWFRQRTLVQGRTRERKASTAASARHCAAVTMAFMPVVVDVRTPDGFKQWVEEQKAAAKQAAAAPADVHDACDRPSPKLVRTITYSIRRVIAPWPTITPPTPPTTTTIMAEPARGHQTLVVRDQSQGHRHDVPGVQSHHVFHRRRNGHGHPCRTVQTWPAIGGPRVSSTK